MESEIIIFSVEFSKSKNVFISLCRMHSLLKTPNSIHKMFIYSLQNFYRPLLVTEDTTLANYTCMLIYTCLTPSNLGDLMATKEGAEVVAGVLNHFAKSETEWG